MQCWPVATASPKTPIRAPSSPPPARQGRGARAASGSPQAGSPPPWTRLNERGTDLRAGPGGIRREAAPTRGRQAQPGGHAQGGRRGPQVPEDLRSQAGSGAGQDRDASSRRLRAGSGHGGWNGTRAGGWQALLKELRVGEDALYQPPVEAELKPGESGHEITSGSPVWVEDRQIGHVVEVLTDERGRTRDIVMARAGLRGEKVLIPVQKVIEVVGPNVQVDL